MTHFTVQKTDITKFLWGDLGASPPQLYGRGAIAPIALMESAPKTHMLQTAFMTTTNLSPTGQILLHTSGASSLLVII